MTAYFTANSPTLVEGQPNKLRVNAAGELMVSAPGGATSVAPAAAADTTGNPTLTGTLAYLLGFNGATWDRLRAGVATVSGTLTGLLNALPVAQFNTTPATRTTGQIGPFEADSTGNLRMGEQFQPVAEDNTVGVYKVEQRFSYANMTTATTTTIKSGAGFLHALTINTYVAAATITMFDNTAGSGNKIGLITLPAAGAGDVPISIIYDVTFATGLTVVTSGATDLTFSFR